MSNELMKLKNMCKSQNGNGFSVVNVVNVVVVVVAVVEEKNYYIY